MRILFTLLALSLAGFADASETSAKPESLVPLNQASVEQLAGIDGIDASVARRIVDLRDKRGNLTSVEALRVLDLPEASLDALRGHTSVDISLPDATTKTYDSVDQVLSEFSGEPTIQQVQGWAADLSLIHI